MDTSLEAQGASPPTPPPPPRLGKVLAACRFLLLGAVIGCIGLQFALIIFAVVLLARTALGLDAAALATGGKDLALAAVQELELFLLATVAWLTSTGLYTLFIDPSAKTWLPTGVESLDDLKAKLIGVIVLALGVLFLGDALSWNGGPDLLYFGLSIAAVILALGVFVRAQK